MKIVSVLMIRWPLFAVLPALAAIVWWLLSPFGPARRSSAGGTRALTSATLRLGCNAALPGLPGPRKDCRSEPPLPEPMPAPPAATPPAPVRKPAKSAYRANSAAHRLSSAPSVSRRSHALH
ncbi:hypothetical protein [Actinoplanes subglobosus]|uniref:Uncharacterized protein n=1 Tax=Actinoplanes subglobosus TaxID=1547892 RepID=A0ABV8IME1_9ACTN